MKKIIVVGAGVSGLAAAVRLQKLGYDVTLYEKEGQPGGQNESDQGKRLYL